MAYTLLVWEEIPEDRALYLIPNEVADKYRPYLTEAQNRFINSDVTNGGMDFLNTALADEAPAPGFEEHLGVLRSYKIDLSTPLENTSITHVYLSGWVM